MFKFIAYCSAQHKKDICETNINNKSKGKLTFTTIKTGV